MDHWLATNRRDYFAHLLPGVTDDQLNAFESQFSLKLPHSFRRLFQWRNGHDQLRSESLVQNLMFSRLEDISRQKELLDGMIGSDFDDPKWWRRSWVPFLENGAGDHLCVDLAAENDSFPGQIIMFYHDTERRPVRALSLEAWLADLVTSMENETLQLA
jgi:cell wall assembly regulator SMI1